MFAYEKIKNKLSCELKQLFDELELNADEVFTLDYFNHAMSQDGINNYNLIIGGKAEQEGSKIKGINEYINEYNSLLDNHTEFLPKLKQLYKQILSDEGSESFRYEAIETIEELSDQINAYYNRLESNVLSASEFYTLFEKLSFSQYDLSKIYLKAPSINRISARVFNDWKFIGSEVEHRFGKDKAINSLVDFLKNEETTSKKQKPISLNLLKESLSEENFHKLIGFFNDQIKECVRDIQDKRKIYEENERANTKVLLDAIKKLQELVSWFITDNTEDLDGRFYNLLVDKYEVLQDVISLYNRARNFITKKPYSLEKFKLNFYCPTLLAGWDKNKEKENLSIIFRKDGTYYLGIVNKNKKEILFNALSASHDNLEGEKYEKMEYKQIPGAAKNLAHKFFSQKGIKEFHPSEELLEKYKQSCHKIGPSFDLDFLHELIAFYKSSIEQCEWKEYNFQFADTESYNNINEFYKDVDDQAYKISFKDVSVALVDELVDSGVLYLFKIYNKDFSPYSHGTPNLHTIYWRALFDEDNLRDVVYKLSGEAEIFFRNKSNIENIVKHEANKPIPCRRDNEKFSTFAYDLIKDKRFTEDKYQLHVSIVLNFKANGRPNINMDAQAYIREHLDDISIIGIDRGERNLLYYSLIDTKGNIKEQGSLNFIETNYRDLLAVKEKERDEARHEWRSIGQIKDLKIGYLSQAIHKITDLMIKHNAIIVLENLNFGFKRSREKIERQIYQVFERMLIDKLNYLVIKTKKEKREIGGLMRAYQLTSQFESFEKIGNQSGFLFYVAPWLTSEIDPTTGFINLLDTHYKNIEKSKEFIMKFVDIRYNKEEGYFEFEVDDRHSHFAKRAHYSKKTWIICTYGDRIIRCKKDGKWICEKLDLTQAFHELFSEYQIRIDHIKDDVHSIKDKNFFERFMRLFESTLHMRNTDSDNDYIISPVKNRDGKFFDSRQCGDSFPKDADANGAYNIARKGLLIIEKIRNSEPIKITNKEWIEFAQNTN